MFPVVRASNTTQCDNQTISCIFNSPYIHYSHGCPHSPMRGDWVFPIIPHYTERHEPLGQVNEKYHSMIIYILIYIVQESVTSLHYYGVPFPHDSIIILLQIHVKYINLLRLKWLVWMTCKHHLKVYHFHMIASSSLQKIHVKLFLKV